MEPTSRPFADALNDLLRDRDEFTTRLGTPNVAAFARATSIHYETWRKILSGDRALTPDVMEAAALACGVRPKHFLEYRLWEARQMFDPGTVGADRASENLQLWEAAQQDPR